MNGFVPSHFDENGKPTMYRWNLDGYLDSLPPKRRRNFERRLRVGRFTTQMWMHIPWMNWPILNVIYCFWQGIFESGIKPTCKPRWGLLTFHYLNDGMKPTLWHTWRQMTHNHTDKYTGIYPSGAPKSLKQAKEWEKKWAEEREQREVERLEIDVPSTEA